MRAFLANLHLTANAPKL